MHYFIDGYNLLFRLVRAFGEEELQPMREKVIEDLSKKIKLLKLDATIVFDSYYHEGFRSRNLFLSTEVLFTDEGETADECIIDELKKSRTPKQEIVVTSDKKLAWQARLKGAQTIMVEEFIKILNQRCQKRSLKKAAGRADASQEKIKLQPKKKRETLIEHYERIFEASSEKIASKKSKTIKLKEAQQTKEKPLSDFERWLQAFEKGSD